MVGVIVITHCEMAPALIKTAELIVGRLPQVEGVGIDPEERTESARRRLLEAVKRVDDGSGTLILTDMFGGTPSNLALSLMEDHCVEVLSGVNLPMLLKLATCRMGEVDLAEVAREVKASGKKNISLASEILLVKSKAKNTKVGGRR